MFFAISLLYCSFAVYIKQQCPPKRASFLRFLAESNCCKRFCRPVPNHSAKEPCCGFASAKLGIIFGICKFYAVYFSFSVYFLTKFLFLCLQKYFLATLDHKYIRNLGLHLYQNLSDNY